MSVHVSVSASCEEKITLMKINSCDKSRRQRASVCGISGWGQREDLS